MRGWGAVEKNRANAAAYVPNRFLNQVALVVGGAQGIGKGIAVRLALTL